MKVKFDYKLGKQSDHEWSGVFGYRPEDANELKELGEIYAVFRFSTEVEDFALDMFSKILLETLQRNFYEDLKNYRSTLDRLEESCWKMKAKMEMLLAREKEVAEVGIDIEMGFFVLVGNYLYAMTIGESRVFIYRQDSLIEITEGLIDKDKKGFLKSASLEIEDGDRFCITTSKALGSDLFDLEEQVSALKFSPDSKESGVGIMVFADENDSWPVEVIGVPQEIEPNVSLYEPSIENENTILDAEFLEEEKSSTKTYDETGKQEEVVHERRTNYVNNGDDFAKNTSEGEYEDEPRTSLKDRALNLVQSFKLGLASFLNRFNRRKKANLSEQELESDLVEEDNTNQNNQTRKSHHNGSQFTQNELVVEGFDDDKGSIIEKFKTFFKQIVLGIKVIFLKITKGIKNHFKNNERTYAHFLNNIVRFFQNLFKNFNKWFKRNILGQTLDRRDLKKVRVQRNRYLFIFAIIFLTSFVYTNYTNGEYAKKVDAAERTIQDKIAEYTTDLAQLSSSASVSINAESDVKTPILGRIQTLTTNLKITIGELDSNEFIKEKTNFNSQLNGLVTSSQNEKDKLLLIQSFTQPQIIADASKDFPDASLTDLEYAEGALFVSDIGRNVVYKVSTELNASLQAHVSGLTAPKLLVKNVAGEVVVYDNDQTAVAGKFSPAVPNSFTRFTNLTPPTSGSVEGVAIYSGNDSLYEIKTENKQIFRRDRQGEGYAAGGIPYQESATSNWRTDGIFLNAIDIEAPYEIYVLIKGLGLSRFFGGSENNLAPENIKGIMPEDRLALNNASAMDIEGTIIAIGDSNGKKIFIFEIQEDSTLKLVKQIQFRGEGNHFANIKEIQINLIDRKLYILDANRVLRADF